MRKKSLSAIISVILAVVLCVTTCTSVFAATSKESYISDLVLCSAKSADAAEKKLKAQGYKLMSDENLNDSLTDGGMYLGYKSTTNSSEAITDISAMNMNGKFSYTDYENLLKNLKESVTTTINGLIPMITAYRANYKAGRTIAVSVHDTLNKFYEDDSKTYMGDYLLNCDLKDTTDITKVFMQGYSAFIVDIQQLLFAAGESSNDKKWIEKMADSSDDFLLDLYIGSYPTPNKAYQALAADYGTSADNIRLTWNVFYENLKNVKNKYFTESNGKLKFNEEAMNQTLDSVDTDKLNLDDNSTTDDAINAMSASIDAQDANSDFVDSVLVSYLDGLEYGDGTMLDFFMRDESGVDDFELYTLAYFMGNKLCAQSANVGLQQVVSRLTVVGDEAQTSDYENIEQMLLNYDEISIYEGVDRTLFENGVALTSATTNKNVSSGKSWSDGLFDRIFQPQKAGEYKWYDFVAFYIMPTVISATCYGTVVGISSHLEKTLFKDLYGKSQKKFIDSCMEVNRQSIAIGKKAVFEEISFNPHLYATDGGVARSSRVIFGKGTLVDGSTKSGGQLISGLRTFFFAVTVILTLVSIGMALYTLFSENEAQTVEYTTIPNHIVDTVTTDNGDDYVAYNYVPNISGNAGDLNNFVGTVGWLTLYYTKDQSVGEPITTDMKIVKGSTKTPLDYEGINLFGEDAALNFTSKDYTGVKDSADGTYIYFNRGEVITTGSVFSSGNMAISIGVGAVIGIAVDMLFQKMKEKRKKTAAKQQ